MTFVDEEPTGEEPQEAELPVSFPTLTHQWRSTGQEVICSTCPNPHGFTLQPGQHLVGVDNGQPVIATVWT